MIRRQMQTKLVGALTGAMILFGALPAFAEGPKEFVQDKTARVIKALKRSESKTRVDELQGILDATVDFRELAKLSLENHWPEDKAKQDRFLDLLSRMLKAKYSLQLAGKTLEDKDEPNINYVKDGVNAKKTKAFVTTKIKGKFKNPKTEKVEERTVEVKYLLLKRGEDWIVYDLFLDGNSTVESYREAYVPIIEEDGWDGLISAMEETAEALESELKKK